ncbi:MAG: hypothetical protein GY953_25890 [bacterium]|nr:hypothetical protein [bacterium]
MDRSSPAKSTAVPHQSRIPWYLATAPCYASIYLWLGFYDPLAEGVVNRANYPELLAGLLVGAVLSFTLYYYVPARLGMTTGYPLGVLGAATFGTRGGRLVPAVLMGVCLTAWLGTALWFASMLLFRGLGISAGPGNLGFAAPAAMLGLGAAYLTLLGFRMVRLIVLPFSLLPAIALPVLFLNAADGLTLQKVDEPEPVPAFLLLVHLVTAFSAVACAAAPEFTMRARDSRDIICGGLAGIVAPILYAGAFGLLTVVGARTLDPGLTESGYLGAAEFVSSNLGAGINFLLALTCIPAACVFALLATRSFRVPFPRASRKILALTVAAGAVAFTLSGAPGNWKLFVTAAGALFAPVCGAIAADFMQAKWKWPQSRPGINFAGYGAVIAGFAVGIAPTVSEGWAVYGHPAAVYSFVTGFAVYVLLGNLGLKPYRKRVRRRKPEHT